jgi:hypothetical protein
MPCFQRRSEPTRATSTYRDHVKAGRRAHFCVVKTFVPVVYA